MASSAEQTAQLKQSTMPFIKIHEPVELPVNFNAFERSIVKPKKRQNTEKREEGLQRAKVLININFL